MSELNALKSTLSADEKANQFILFIRHNFQPKLPQTQVAVFQEYQALEANIQHMTDDISAEKQLEIARAYAATFEAYQENTVIYSNRSILQPEDNILRWLESAATKGDAKLKLNIAILLQQGEMNGLQNLTVATKLFDEILSSEKNDVVIKQHAREQLLLSREAITKKLLDENERCPISLSKLISFEEDDAIIPYVPGQTVITEKDLKKLAMTPNGFIYDREQITKALTLHQVSLEEPGTDPISKQPLHVNQLIPLTAKNVDLSVLNQRLGLAVLKKGIESAKGAIVKASEQLDAAPEDNKQSVKSLIANLEKQAEEVNELLTTRLPAANSYSKVAQKTLSLVKENDLSKTLEDYESTVVGKIEKAINFFLVRWLKQEPIRFFDHPSISVAREVTDALKHTAKMA